MTDVQQYRMTDDEFDLLERTISAFEVDPNGLMIEGLDVETGERLAERDYIEVRGDRALPNDAGLVAANDFLSTFEGSFVLFDPLTTAEFKLLGTVVERALDGKAYAIADAELATANVLATRRLIRLDDRRAQPERRGYRAYGDWKRIDDASAARSDAFWDRPGGRLLRKILPVWRESTAEGVLDDFLSRELPRVVDALEAWIAKDPERTRRFAEQPAAEDANRLLGTPDEFVLGPENPGARALEAMESPPDPDAIREDARRLALQATALGGTKFRALDRFREDADGRTIARTLQDLTAPRRWFAEVAQYLERHNFDEAAEEVRREALTEEVERGEIKGLTGAKPTKPTEPLRDRVWDAIFQAGERLTPVRSEDGQLHVLDSAIHEEGQPWVAVRRVEDGRVLLDQVVVEIVSRAGESAQIRPVGETDELEPGDSVHVWSRSSPGDLIDLYAVVGTFLDDWTYKPRELADLASLLFWTGLMIDTPQCSGEAKRKATEAFNKAKIYYDAAREAPSSDVWTLGVLHRITLAAAAVTTACAEGRVAELEFDEERPIPSYPAEIDSTLRRALYDALGRNPGLARRVDAAARRVDRGGEHDARVERIEAAIAPIVAPDEVEIAEMIVEVLGADVMLAPGLRAIYEVLNWDFQRTMKVQKALEAGLPDSWRGYLPKERVVMRELYDVLGDEETTRRVFKIVKEETDF